MIIGTLTTGSGVVSTINLQYLPQQIWYVAATQLTSLKVEVLGEDAPIVDLDADGLSAIGLQDRVGNVTNSYIIPLADGLVTNKNVVMTFTNSAAQTPDINAFSKEEGLNFVKSSKQKVLASSGVDVPGDSFDLISFENGTNASDVLNITFIDEDTGKEIVQKFTLADLQIDNSIDSRVNNTDEDYYIEQDGTILNINYVPNADTTLYIVKREGT